MVSEMQSLTGTLCPPDLSSQSERSDLCTPGCITIGQIRCETNVYCPHFQDKTMMPSRQSRKTTVFKFTSSTCYQHDDDLPRTWSFVKDAVWERIKDDQGFTYLQGFVRLHRSLRVNQLKAYEPEVFWGPVNNRYKEFHRWTKWSEDVVERWVIGSPLPGYILIKNLLEGSRNLEEDSDKENLSPNK